MEEQYSEFIKRIKKVTGHRKHSVTNSLGVRDAMNHYRKNRPKESSFVLSPSQYYSIIRKVNEMLGEQLLKGCSIKLPYRMGSLYIVKKLRQPKLNEAGKLVYRVPIDWDATLKLWYESEEDLKNKTLIKVEDKNGYKFHYERKHTDYENQSVTQFLPTRALKLKLKQLIKSQSLEGYNTNV